jgi:hypothetical protein
LRLGLATTSHLSSVFLQESFVKTLSTRNSRELRCQSAACPRKDEVFLVGHILLQLNLAGRFGIYEHRAGLGERGSHRSKVERVNLRRNLYRRVRSKKLVLDLENMCPFFKFLRPMVLQVSQMPDSKGATRTEDLHQENTTGNRRSPGNSAQSRGGQDVVARASCRIRRENSVGPCA